MTPIHISLDDILRDYDIQDLRMAVVTGGQKVMRPVASRDEDGIHPVLNKGEVEVHTKAGEVVIVTPQPENSNGTKVHHNGRRRRR